MKLTALASIMLLSAGTAQAFDIESISVAMRNATGLNQVRSLNRDGSNPSDWSKPAQGVNTTSHKGVSAGFFEDAGTGRARFGVKADKDGKATVLFQDVGDTKHFDRLTLNGKTIEVPEPARKNGGVIAVTFSGLKANAWNGLRAVTHLLPGSKGKGHAQDHFGVKGSSSVCRG